jgi:uncharacterized protein (UPF0276 family)
MDKPSPLGFGLGLRPVYYEDILERNPNVDWFEVLSENYMVPGGRPLAMLDRFDCPARCRISQGSQGAGRPFSA